VLTANNRRIAGYLAATAVVLSPYVVNYFLIEV